MNDQPMTRRQAREAAAAAELVAPAQVAEEVAVEVVAEAVENIDSIAALSETPDAQDTPLSRRELRERERPNTAAVTPGDSLFGQLVEFSENHPIDEIQFPSTGPIKILEPTALVVDAVPDITNMSMILSDSGVVIQTGAIDLPWLKTDSAELQEVTDAANAADAASKVDAAQTGITPIPARVHERTRRKASVFPSKLRRGWGIVYLTALSAFLLGAVFCAFLAAFMLGLIKL